MYLTYVLSNNAYKLTETKIYSFQEILTILTPVLFNKQTREGLVIISENLLSYHQLGYIIFGKTEKRARELEEKMIQLLAA